MKNILSLFSICLIPVFSLAQGLERVYVNGKIYTADENNTFVTAMCTNGNTITYLGDDEGVEDCLGKIAGLYDLEGKTMIPGLFDTHIHLLEAGSDAAASCALSWNTNSVVALVNELQACNPEPNSNGWIFSWGHSIYPLIESGQHPLNLLSAAFPDTPVAAMDETSHSAWVNQAAMDALSITASTPDPEGGHIVKDADGELFGLLLDAAGDLAFQAANATNPENEQANLNGLINYGMPSMAAMGITSITEGRTYWKRNYHDTWQHIRDNGDLTLRVNLALYAHPEDEDAAAMDSLLALYDAGDEWLRINQVKLYIDGIAINGTAAMEEPYIYPFGWPFNSGLNYFTPERLTNYITTLETEGLDFHIHTIGNRGVREALDAIEAARLTNGDVGARHKVTHIEWVNPSDYSRFSELNVTADAQVSSFWTQPNAWQDNAYLVGSQVASTMIPIRSIYDEGGRITLSSDWDVSTFNPFKSIQNAVTRDPEALPSVEAAVRAKTIDAAYSSRSEAYTGSLEVGKRADFAILDLDIFTIPHGMISQTNVIFTVVDGNVVYDDGSLELGTQDLQPTSHIGPTLATNTLYLTTPSEGAFEIFDLSGKLALSGTFTQGVNTISLTSLSEGIHFITLSNPSLTESHKFVISR